VSEGSVESGDDDEHTGVLVLRVWARGRLPEGLRARITSSLDLSSGDEVVTMAADVESVLAAVRDWLETFTSS
jgi:hypothetical protein